MIFGEQEERTLPRRTVSDYSSKTNEKRKNFAVTLSRHWQLPLEICYLVKSTQPGKSQNIPITRQELKSGNKRRLIIRLLIRTEIDTHEKDLEVRLLSSLDEVRLPLTWLGGHFGSFPY